MYARTDAELNAVIDALKVDVQAGRVVPIVGPGMLRTTSSATGRSTSESVGEALLAAYHDQPEVVTLFDATRQLQSADRISLDGVRRFVSDYVLRQTGLEQPGLQALAEVRQFRTFVTTTIEPTLARVLQGRALDPDDVGVIACQRGVGSVASDRGDIINRSIRLVVHLLGAVESLVSVRDQENRAAAGSYGQLGFPGQSPPPDLDAAMRRGRRSPRVDFAVSEDDFDEFMIEIPGSDFVRDVRGFVNANEGRRARENPTASGDACPMLLLLGAELPPRMLSLLLKLTTHIVWSTGRPIVRSARIADAYAAADTWLPAHLRAFSRGSHVMTMSPVELMQELARRIRSDAAEPRAHEFRAPEVLDRVLVVGTADDRDRSRTIADWLSSLEIDAVAYPPRDEGMDDARRLDALCEDASAIVAVFRDGEVDELERRPLVRRIRELVLQGRTAKIIPLRLISDDDAGTPATPALGMSATAVENLRGDDLDSSSENARRFALRVRSLHRQSVVGSTQEPHASWPSGRT